MKKDNQLTVLELFKFAKGQYGSEEENLIEFTIVNDVFYKMAYEGVKKMIEDGITYESFQQVCDTGISELRHSLIELKSEDPNFCNFNLTNEIYEIDEDRIESILETLLCEDANIDNEEEMDKSYRSESNYPIVLNRDTKGIIPYCKKTSIEETKTKNNSLDGSKSQSTRLSKFIRSVPGKTIVVAAAAIFLFFITPLGWGQKPTEFELYYNETADKIIIDKIILNSFPTKREDGRPFDKKTAPDISIKIVSQNKDILNKVICRNCISGKSHSIHLPIHLEFDQSYQIILYDFDKPDYEGHRPSHDLISQFNITLSKNTTKPEKEELKVIFNTLNPKGRTVEKISNHQSSYIKFVKA